MEISQKKEIYPYKQLEEEAPDTNLKPKQNLSSSWQVSINLLKAFIGSGILGLPYAYNLNGICQSWIITILIMCSMVYTTYLIDDLCIYVKDKFEE